MKIGMFLFKYRSFFPIPYIIFLLYFFTPAPHLFLIGCILLFLGCIFRVFIQRYTGDWTRGNEIGGERLLTSGPFSIVRHPLYLANFIMGAGYTILSGYKLFILFPLYILLFGVYYSLIIMAEERYLSLKFSKGFLNYKSRVPAIIPFVLKWERGAPFSWSLGFKKELSTIITTIVILILFAGRWIWMR